MFRAPRVEQKEIERFTVWAQHFLAKLLYELPSRFIFDIVEQKRLLIN